MCADSKREVHCLQETHRGDNDTRPEIAGMKLVLERSHEQHGSAVFVKESLSVSEASMSMQDNLDTNNKFGEDISDLRLQASETNIRV